MSVHFNYFFVSLLQVSTWTRCFIVKRKGPTSTLQVSRHNRKNWSLANYILEFAMIWEI